MNSMSHSARDFDHEELPWNTIGALFCVLALTALGLCGMLATAQSADLLAAAMLEGPLGAF